MDTVDIRMHKNKGNKNNHVVPLCDRKNYVVKNTKKKDSSFSSLPKTRIFTADAVEEDAIRFMEKYDLAAKL